MAVTSSLSISFITNMFENCNMTDPDNQRLTYMCDGYYIELLDSTFFQINHLVLSSGFCADFK